MRIRSRIELGSRSVILAAMGMILAASARLDAQDPPNETRAEPTPVKVVLVGDSTVSPGSGWGPGFAERLGPGAVCVNAARSGRSSRSFRDEGHWARALAERPDCVLIQFGHNDQPGKGPARETDPATTYRQSMARYVDEARAAGAVPILVTSLTRRTFTADGKIQPDGLIPYVEAVRSLAKEKGVPLVDLHARSVAALERMGPVAAAALNPPGKEPGTVDRTHLTAEGARITAALVIDELRAVAPDLARHLR